MIACSGVGAYEKMLRDADIPMSRVSVETPTLIMVVQGSLRLRWAGNECLRCEGQAVAVAEGQTFDMIARLPPDGGRFEAHWLRCDPVLAAECAEFQPLKQPIRDAFPIEAYAAEFAEAFAHMAAAIARASHLPEEVPALRAREMLAWLAYSGATFARLERFLITRRVRMAIAKTIETEWTIGRMAAELAISTSTLRRRLAMENTSFNELLIGVRMSRAFTLLQVTDLPILQIAYRTGYDSPSRFTARFRQRFGLSPSDVRLGEDRP